jgi:flavin reductase (DIM6/NTAB) family NADH-FMN oxidoreductase RutF
LPEPSAVPGIARTTVGADEMRRTLGRFCTGVTVVTTVHDGDVHAMTANAFVSVSLDPPLVLVSVDHRAKMHRVLSASERYGVSVLSSAQERLAWHFAGRPHPEPGELFEWADELPLVRGAIAHVACRLDAAHPAGDHTLYLGLVEHLVSRPGDPLLFHGGSFGKLGIEEPTGW